MLPDNNGYTIQVQNPKVFFTPEVRFFVVRFHDYGLLQEDFRGNYRHYSRCNAAVGGLYSRVCAERFPFGKKMFKISQGAPPIVLRQSNEWQENREKPPSFPATIKQRA